jgi:hypothetical protein
MNEHKSLNGPVITYFLSPEELEEVRKKSSNSINSNYKNKHRKTTWKWPNSRRGNKNGTS